jgi:outer membrane protein TolC
MTLEQALSEARAHHPALLAAKARQDASRAEARIPAMSWYPTFGASAQLLGGTDNNSTATTLPSALIDLPRIGGTAIKNDMRWAPQPSTLLALGGRQLLFDAGRTSAETESLRQMVEVERARSDSTELDVELATTSAFYAVLSSHEIVDAAEQAVARAKARREFVEAAVGKDLRPRVELTRADADVARFEVTRIRAIGSLRIARSNLALATGASELEVEATSAGEGAKSVPTQRVNEEEISRAVEEKDPALRGARHLIDAQHAATRAIEARAWPILSLTGAVSGRAGGAAGSNGTVSDGDGWLPIVPNWSVGLVLSVPLYDATNSARVEASRARETAFRMELEGLRVSQVGVARQAHRMVEVSALAVDAVERSVVAARANYEQAEARFKAGLATTVEVSEAETFRAEAEAQLAVTRFDVLKANATLRRATGQR